MTPNQIIDEILIRETSLYTDRPADRGGPTRWGVTQATLAEWRGKPVTPDDVRNLSETEAREIYREEYLIRPGFLSIESEAVRTLAVDCAVNHGVKQAVILLQRAARVSTDGIFGPNTQAAVNRMPPSVVYLRLCAARVRLYGSIISRDPELKRAHDAGFTKLQAFNAGGWTDRAADFIEEIL